MKKNRFVVFVALSCTVLVTSSPAYSAKEPTEWLQLFNGKNLDGWTPKFRRHEVGENYLDTFRVEDGLLKVRYDKYENFNAVFGHLFYKETFSHYVLRAEYRVVGEQVAGGAGWAVRNNGLMIHGQSPQSMLLDQSFPVSIEVQLLGGDGKAERSTGNLCTPGTNVVMDGKLITKHCMNSTSPTFHGDQWVTAEVEVHGSRLVRHKINGVVVLEYSEPQLDPEDEFARPRIKKGAKLLSRGTISIQAESHPFDFRKIELQTLRQ